MTRQSDLPPEVAERVRRHRARLDGKGQRIASGPESVEEHLAELDDSTSAVLIIDSLPRRERQLRETLERLRGRLRPGAQVRIVQRSRPLAVSVARRVAERLVGQSAAADQHCDVPAAIRSSGFIVASIERFDVERDGAHELWVDVVAIDLGPPSTE